MMDAKVLFIVMINLASSPAYCIARKLYKFFYDFTAAGRVVKLKSVNFYYYVAKTLRKFDSIL